MLCFALSLLGRGPKFNPAPTGMDPNYIPTPSFLTEWLLGRNRLTYLCIRLRDNVVFTAYSIFVLLSVNTDFGGNVCLYPYAAFPFG